MEFDKQILKKNISYLIKKKGIKIGDLESSIGVSTGYISRINKKNNGVVAGVDIIHKIAHELEVSMDVLISVDLEMVNDNDKYLLNLMKKFELKTEAREIFWEKIEPHEIKGMLNGEISSNLSMFTIAPGQNRMGFDSYGELRKIYISFFLGQELVPEGDPYMARPWFSFKLDDNNTVYITYMIYSPDGTENKVVLELYIDTKEYYEYYDENGDGDRGYTHSSTPLCCSENMGEEIEKAITSLYRTISKHQNDVRITDNVKNALDNFMKK